MSNNKSLNIIDLFSGCGGFGLGAHQAGFNTQLAIDLDPVLQSSYSKNFPDAKVLTADLSETNKKFWVTHLQHCKVDGVIGGPPCQGYSRMGHSDEKDMRRTLLAHFFRNVNLIMPNFFVMENVEGLIDKRNVKMLDQALATVSSKFQTLDPFVIDAADCGAATKRRRVIVIGYNPDEYSSLKVEDFTNPLYPKTTVRDAIFDLPSPIETTQRNTHGWSEYSAAAMSEYSKKMRALPKFKMGDIEAKHKLSQGLVSGCFNTTHSPQVAARYGATPRGSVDPISRSKKLSWSGLCPTLRAGTGPDRGSHQAVRPLHPSEARVITVREAARLQGFPDWFLFHRTKWHSFRMIGNSVSPLVAQHLLTVIRNAKIPKSQTS